MARQPKTLWFQVQPFVNKLDNILVECKLQQRVKLKSCSINKSISYNNENDNHFCFKWFQIKNNFMIVKVDYWIILDLPRSNCAEHFKLFHHMDSNATFKLKKNLKVAMNPSDRITKIIK